MEGQGWGRFSSSAYTTPAAAHKSQLASDRVVFSRTSVRGAIRSSQEVRQGTLDPRPKVRILPPEPARLIVSTALNTLGSPAPGAAIASLRAHPPPPPPRLAAPPNPRHPDRARRRCRGRRLLLHILDL